MKTANFRAIALVFVSTLLFAQSSLAVGGADDAPPAKTETTEKCYSEQQWDPELNGFVKYSEKVNGVWDPELKKCIRPDKAGYLKSELLENAVRELAYEGRHTEAQIVLSQMEQDSDFALTYWGFTHRQLGDLDAAARYYSKAIERNPDNVLARSYMAQGLVLAGDFVGARQQLHEIRARGGSNTWAEESLVMAIEKGTAYSY